MREPYRVDVGLDDTIVRIRRAPYLRHHQPLFVLSAVFLLAAVLSATWALIPVALATAAVGGALLYRSRPDHHQVVLRPAGFEVDGRLLDPGTLTMVLTDEKLVLSDGDELVELWHGIRAHRDRMALRAVLEEALDDVRERHGRGRIHVPTGLRQLDR
jgi:hypothetical protein